MNLLIRPAATLAILVAGGFVASAPAQYLDQIGMTTLQVMTANLNGTGVTVGQVEAGYGSAPNWQVNPSLAGQPTNLFTWIAETAPPYPATISGYFPSPLTANAFTNSLGVESIHANGVGTFFYGNPGGVATNVVHVNNYEAFTFYYHYVYYNNTLTDRIVNQSFSFGSQTIANQQLLDSKYDNSSVHNKTLFVSAVNNYGNLYGSTTNVCAPGTSYNCVGVGAYKNGSSYNSLGPTTDNGRCKPDISAVSDVTSDSTPQVAGAAAVLMQAGFRGDGGSDTTSAVDMRTIKTLLLNGAVKPVDWTNNAPSPLDYRYGAGVLNVFNSYEQLAGGKHGFILNTTYALGGAHPPTGASGTVGVLSGWDFNTNSSGKSPSQFDSVNHYYFNVTNDMGASVFSASATLVWNRQQNQSAINNLDMFLYDCANSNLVMCSTSLVDNVEHIYLPQLASGRYDLQVWKAGGSTIVSAAEPYALAWAFTTQSLNIAALETNVALTWPVYPAGFLVESTTNLTAPAVWVANNLPTSGITNSSNYLWLNPTNANQFFRLRQPNF